MINNELKSCPFCGSPYASKPEVKSYYDGYSPGLLYFVKCTYCFATTSRHLESEEEAILAWNKRVVND